MCTKGYKTLENRDKLNYKFNDQKGHSTVGAGNSDVKVRAGLRTEIVEVRGDIGAELGNQDQNWP